MRPAQLGLILLPLCLTACAAFPQRELALSGGGNDTEMRLAAARSREQQGDLEQAKQIYLELLAQDPQSPVAHHRLGLLAVRQGALNEGLAHLERARAKTPNNAELVADIGYTLYLQGRLDESAEALRNALNLDPGNKRSLNNLGLVLGKQGRTQDAHGVFRQMGSEAESLAKMGYIHAQLGNLEEAEDSYSKALDHDNELTIAAEALLQIAEQRKAQAKAAANGKAELLTKKPTSSKSDSFLIAGLEPLPSGQRTQPSPRRLAREGVADRAVKPRNERPAESETGAVANAVATISQSDLESTDRRNAHAYFTAPSTPEQRTPRQNIDHSSSIRLTSAESSDESSSSPAAAASRDVRDPEPALNRRRGS